MSVYITDYNKKSDYIIQFLKHQYYKLKCLIGTEFVCVKVYRNLIIYKSVNVLFFLYRQSVNFLNKSILSLFLLCAIEFIYSDFY